MPIERDTGAPQGNVLDIEIEAEGAPEVEIEIDEEGGAIISIDKEDDTEWDANLAEILPDEVLEKISEDLQMLFEADKASRADWDEMYSKGMELLGFKFEERTKPFKGASGVYHPMLTEAIIQFQSQALKELMPAGGPVRTQILGKETRERLMQAQRVKDFMNYQITTAMPEYTPDFDQLLFYVGYGGSAFKKIYYDYLKKRMVSKLITPDNLYIPYNGSSVMSECERITYRVPMSKNMYRKSVVAGQYTDKAEASVAMESSEIQDATDKLTGVTPNDEEEEIFLLEFQIDYDLPGFEDKDEDGEPTGIKLPYIITLDEVSGNVVGVRRNWKEDDETKTRKEFYVHYLLVQGPGSYGLGFLHLIGGLTKTASASTRQLTDAGTLANLPAGFKAKGARIENDDVPISPGEWRDMDAGGLDLSQSLLPLPYKEPSQTLAALLQEVVEEGRRLAATADVKISDMNGEAPVGTTLAILERTLKVMSAIQARNHVSMSQEFKLIAGLIKDYTAPYYSYQTSTTGVPTYAAKRSDYEQTDIVPVSDPNSSTMAQRIIQYQSAIQLSQMAPQIYNLPLLHKQMLRVMGIKDVDKIIETDDALKPTDPVSENMEVIKGKPAKAFIEQNHDAHIAVHQAFINDPNTAQMMQNNPNAPAVMQAFQAHLMEHYGFQYRAQLEQQLGMPLPPPGEPLPPEMESQIGPLLAQAASQLNQMHGAQAQQAQAQQQMQDPLFQQSQQELQLKEQEINNKFTIEQAKIDAQLEIARMNNNAKMGLQVAKDESTHQLKAAEILDRKMNPPPPPAPGGFPGGKK